MRNGIIILIISLVAVSCKKATLFTIVPQSESHIDFRNDLEKKPLFNILYYLYYYNGGGVAIGDINNDGLPDIYFTANSKGHNKLYLNKGNFVFEDVTEKAGVKGSADWCSGVTMADVNGDGLLDIYVSAVSKRYELKGHNELFINNGNNTFTEKSAAYGLDFKGATTQAAFFDYDRDGDLDCYILNQSHYPHANIRDTSFRHSYDSISGDRLYENDLNTTGKFIDVSKQAGIYQSSLGYGLGISVADFNNDGWDDIYIGNDFHENDYYYLNNGDGTFTESGAKQFRHYSRFSMGNDAADFNNDGQTDVVTVDMLPPDEKTLKTYGSDENADIYKLKLTHNGYQDQFSRNCLQLNNGNGVSFSDIALQAGVASTDWSWAPLFADYDNDGKKDLFISSGIVKRPVDLDYVRFASNLKNSGMDFTDKFDDTALQRMPDGSSHPFLFQNKDGVSFADKSSDWGTENLKGYYNGAAYADLDNDGNLDIVINSLNANAVVLRNNSSSKNHITLSLTGEGMNRLGIGARVWLFTSKGMQYQQVMGTRGFQSCVDTRLHFGMDSVRLADSLLIVWPDQKFQVIGNIEAKKPLTLYQKNASGNFVYNEFFKPAKPVFTDITDSINIKWKHNENDFLDYNIQYLIPHQESTRGPKIAVGDVNKDGLDDIYVCGAKGQAGRMMVQEKDGSFQPVDTTLFNEFAICEDVDAEFFDANNDGFLDLWVVSGGNESPQSEFSSLDRLFLNDGKGHFKYEGRAIPKLNENKSCIAIADVDHDGDLDVFAGFLSDPVKYGIPPHSYLYLNDGKGMFSVADKQVMNLLNLGMVTTAAFTDLNNDGWSDLVVTGEWMPLKIFINNHGKFIESDIAASSGLWQSVYTTDINGDGLTDILAGNWGHNTKLWAGKNGPLKLYVKDFDHNGTIEQIMCYTIDGKEYTFLAKDELERALPVLKKYYLTYSEVAGQTVQYMFYDLFKDYKEYKAEVLASSCFVNDGKGGFKRMDLPDRLQMAPLMAFDTLPPDRTSHSDGGKRSFIAAGNFYGVIPYEGRYDAFQPTIFSFTSKAGNNIDILSTIPGFTGEARDMKWLRSVNGTKLLMIATNNSNIRVYKMNK